jgi:hypothetical protein
MSNIEAHLAVKLKAKRVSVSHNEETITTNRKSQYRNYLLVELEDPLNLIDIKHNKLLFNEKCKALSEYLLDSVQWQGIDFKELQIDIIQEHGFFIFKRKETTNVNYKVVRG